MAGVKVNLARGLFNCFRRARHSSSAGVRSPGFSRQRVPTTKRVWKNFDACSSSDALPAEAGTPNLSGAQIEDSFAQTKSDSAPGIAYGFA